MKKIFFIVFFIINVYNLSSQDIAQVFINIPDRYVPVLTKERRSELMFRYGMLNVDTITNDFRGISKVSILDRENLYMKVDLSDKSVFELKIWNREDASKVIGISHTVCGPVCDSHVAFFNANFERLDLDETPVLPNIGIVDFINPDKITSPGQIEGLIKKYDVLFASIQFLTDGNILVTSHTKEYLPAEIYQEIEPYLLGNKMLLVWSDGIFKKRMVTW